MIFFVLKLSAVCEYYVHVDCQEFAVSDCKECATYVSSHKDDATLSMVGLHRVSMYTLVTVDI